MLTAINVNGVVNTVMPALAVMRGRGRGQIAVTASLAGLQVRVCLARCAVLSPRLPLPGRRRLSTRIGAGLPSVPLSSRAPHCHCLSLPAAGQHDEHPLLLRQQDVGARVGAGPAGPLLDHGRPHQRPVPGLHRHRHDAVSQLHRSDRHWLRLSSIPSASCSPFNPRQLRALYRPVPPSAALFRARCCHCSSVPTVVNGITTIKTLPGMVGVDWAADRFIEGLARDKAVITASGWC